MSGAGEYVPLGTAAAGQTLVCLARHGQPEGDDGFRRFRGQVDPPLSLLGIEQARRLAGQLQPCGFEAVYSSDLRRSAQTAQIVAEKAGLPVTEDVRLREIASGLWEELTGEEARRRYPRQYAEREEDILGYPFPGGESYRQLERRVVPAFEDIRARGYRRLLIVSHLGVNRVLLCHLKGRPLETLFGLKQDYCAYELVWRPAA